MKILFYVVHLACVCPWPSERCIRTQETEQNWYIVLLLHYEDRTQWDNDAIRNGGKADVYGKVRMYSFIAVSQLHPAKLSVLSPPPLSSQACPSIAPA